MSDTVKKGQSEVDMALQEMTPIDVPSIVDEGAEQPENIFSQAASHRPFQNLRDARRSSTKAAPQHIHFTRSTKGGLHQLLSQTRAALDSGCTVSVAVPASERKGQYVISLRQQFAEIPVEDGSGRPMTLLLSSQSMQDELQRQEQVGSMPRWQRLARTAVAKDYSTTREAISEMLAIEAGNDCFGATEGNEDDEVEMPSKD